MSKRKTPNIKNAQFIDSAVLNDLTYLDYLNRFRKVATSVFEWVNLPHSMNARAIELSLFLNGQCSFLFDSDYGYINTNCATARKIKHLWFANSIKLLFL